MDWKHNDIIRVMGYISSTPQKGGSDDKRFLRWTMIVDRGGIRRRVGVFAWRGLADALYEKLVKGIDVFVEGRWSERHTADGVDYALHVNRIWLPFTGVEGPVVSKPSSSDATQSDAPEDNIPF